MTEYCVGCARDCGVDRRGGDRGFCGMPSEPVVARAGLHFGEEPCISGDRGSGTVFFSGCSMKCVFCQNYRVSHEGLGKRTTVKRLAEIFRELEQAGAHNINLVTPSHYTDAIAEALELYRPSVPIVYNSGGYDSPASIRRLSKLVDIYLMDFKFFDNARAIKYAAAPNYREVAEACILAAYENVGKELEINSSGIMTRGLIVRHLILPQGTRDAIAVIERCAELVPNAGFSLMSQYVPMGELSECPELSRRITPREYDKVASRLAEKSFPLIYGQELGSATELMIPEFDFSGV